MTENEVITNYKVAVVIDGSVADTIMCDQHTWALYTSNPIFVDVTDNPDQLAIGDSYSVTE
jgi:hypothetical protein